MGVHNDRVALVHIPKTAGWSIKRLMAEHLDGVKGPEDPSHRELGIEPVDMPKGHVRLADFQRYLGRSPDTFDLILAVRRNPYEREVSQWLFWRRAWNRGLRMPQHFLAATHPTLERWLEDERSAYHVQYDYHEHRPPKLIGESYEDYGGFYRYWLCLDGDLTDTVECMDVTEVNDRVPGLLQPYATSDVGELPRDNAQGSYEIDEHMTPRAQEIIERRYAWSFEQGWYERGVW